MNTADLCGQRFGKLTVMEDPGRRKGGSILWRCRCDCGGEVFATRAELASGHVASCGCVPAPHTPQNRAEDLTGRQFGELTVIRRVKNNGQGQVCWLCRCSCGNQTAVPAPDLRRGHTRSCGCLRSRARPGRRDLTGQRFGRLTVLCRAAPMGKARAPAWHCRCDCGNETDVLAGNLLRGLTQSCGCRNREQSAAMHAHMHYQDGTCLEVLKRIPAAETKNKAGFRGLFLTKSGKYRAAITFRQRHYTLGYYATFSEAVQARLAAETVLQTGYVEAFARYEAKAKADPAWAAQNPFYFNVTRANGEFRVSTNG